MSANVNKDLISRFYKEWDDFGGDAAKVRTSFEKYYAPGYTYHTSTANMNLEQTIQAAAAFASAFPDLKLSIKDMVAEGDKVVTLYTMTGTHKGAFGGIPATGKQVSFEGMMLNKILEGKVVEEWELFDSLGLMTQLGVIPAIAPKK